MSNGKGILDTITGLFGGHKDEQSTTGTQTSGFSLDSVTDLLGNDTVKGLLSQLDGLKSLDASEIQTVLGALSKSADPKVQEAKTDLASVQHDGETFVTKLKGYISSLKEIIPTLLPALQSILGKK